MTGSVSCRHQLVLTFPSFTDEAGAGRVFVCWAKSVFVLRKIREVGGTSLAANPLVLSTICERNHRPVGRHPQVSRSACLTTPGIAQHPARRSCSRSGSTRESATEGMKTPRGGKK